jgi:hypothetical protein
MMAEVPTRLAEVLAAAPDPVLSSGSIGARLPSSAGEMPAIAISLTVESSDSLGLGRLVRGWDEIPNSSNVRDETRGDRYDGVVSLEVWGASFAQVSGISQSLETRLGADRTLLREKGFVSLRPAGLAAAENVMHPAATSAAFAAWRQRVDYRFIFETQEGGEPIDGGLIERVDVDLAKPPEAFSTPVTSD